MASWEEYLHTAIYAEWCRKHSGHVDYVCPSNHDDPCMFCDGGLTACVRCHGLEGSLTSECPGVALDYDTDQRVYHGIIDYRFGQWVAGCTVIMSHLYLHPPELPPGYQWDWDEVQRYIDDHPYEPQVIDSE